MHYGFKRHIRFFHAPEKETGGFIDGITSLYSRGKEGLKDISKSLRQGSIDEIVNQYRNNPNTKDTLKILQDFGLLDSRGVFDKGQSEKIEAALAASWKDGKERILVVSNGSYVVKVVEEYRQEILKDIKDLNVSVFRSIFSSKENLARYQRLFDEKTWGDLALYFEIGGWRSRLLDGVSPDLYKGFFDPIATKRKKEAGQALSVVTQRIEKRFSTSPEVQKGLKLLGENIGVTFTPEGNVDIDALIRVIFDKTKGNREGKSESQILAEMKKGIEEIEAKLKELAQNTQKEREKLLHEIGGPGLTIGHFPELSHIDTMSIKGKLKKEDIRNKTILALTREEALHLVRGLSTIEGAKISPKLAKLIIVLGLQVKLSNVQEGAGATKELGRNLNTKKGVVFSREVDGKISGVAVMPTLQAQAQTAGKISVQAQNLKDAQTVLTELDGITSVSEAQKKLIELQKKGINTDEDRRKEARYLQYIEANSALGRSYTQLKNTYGEKEAQEIFGTAYSVRKGSSENENTQINYASLETIGVVFDPESTPGEIAFARMQPGQSIPMSTLLDSTSTMNAPELTDIKVVLNPNGNYSFENFDAKNISRDEVIEYKKMFTLYADLGLSQLIPHIPLLMQEMRKDGIPVVVDGSTGTMEQQKILKYLHKLLFNSEVNKTSLADVQDAFVRSLQNPTNMKTSIQNRLIVLGLIPSAGRSIGRDTLARFIESNRPINLSQYPL